jgi:hypothetical protein
VSKNSFKPYVLIYYLRYNICWRCSPPYHEAHD